MAADQYEDDFAEGLPRDVQHMDGSNFTIEAVADQGCVIISDGERSAAYRFLRGDQLEMTKLRVRPRYIEAGWFCEAHVVTLTDGSGEAVFVPA